MGELHATGIFANLVIGAVRTNTTADIVIEFAAGTAVVFRRVKRSRRVEKSETDDAKDLDVFAAVE